MNKSKSRNPKVGSYLNESVLFIAQNSLVRFINSELWQLNISTTELKLLISNSICIELNLKPILCHGNYFIGTLLQVI